MTAIRRYKSQSRSPLGRWEEKLHSAPETGALFGKISGEEEPERIFRVRKERTLLRSETAFLYATLGEPGSDVFDSFERIGELADAESALATAVWGRGTEKSRSRPEFCRNRTPSATRQYSLTTLF